MRRLGSSLLYATTWFAVFCAVLWVGVEVLGYATPPERPPAFRGAGFRAERGSQHLIHLSGDAYALGYYNASLLQEYMAEQEGALMDLLFSFAPETLRALLVRKLSLFYLAGLDQYLLERERLEILGLAEGGPDRFPDIGPRYARIAAYHAVHELSHMFIDHPVMACSLLAVGGARGQNGHAFLARNFDFEGGDIFDRHKVILAVKPESGYGFVSVAWSGMAGVVSGINEHGLAITLNAGASADYNRVGAPTTLLVRRALEGARTVDEAIEILTAPRRFVTDIIGLAEKSGRVAVLEMTPNHHALREGDLLPAANHMETDALADDPIARDRIQTTTTAQRRARLARLSERDAFGPEDLLRILRDRAGETGTELPLAHRHAIDALIATHSVIFDATGGRVWVSEGPHTLGAYHGYDINKLLAATNAFEMQAAYLPSLAADELLEIYPLVKNARASLKLAEQDLDAGDLASAKRQLTRTAALGDHPKTLYLRGRLARAQGDDAWAGDFLNAALRAPPEYAADADEIRAALKQ